MSYKLLRSLPQADLRDWLDVSRTVAVTRVLPNTMVAPRSLFNAADCARTVERENIPGCIVECGVWLGGCAALMALMAPSRTVHLFDSFAGLPAPQVEDGPVILGDFRRGGAGATPLGELTPINAAAAPRPGVERFLYGNLGLDPARVLIHEGWFQETLPMVDVGPIAVLRVDADWYESTKVALAHLAPQVVPGGFIIVDDYYYFEGCRRATDEILGPRKWKTLANGAVCTRV
jgi:hypothetical protein